MTTMLRHRNGTERDLSAAQMIANLEFISFRLDFNWFIFIFYLAENYINQFSEIILFLIKNSQHEVVEDFHTFPHFAFPNNYPRLEFVKEASFLFSKTGFI